MGFRLPDGRLAAAVVDRLTCRAHVIETGSESYRLRASQGMRRGGGAKACPHDHLKASGIIRPVDQPAGRAKRWVAKEVYEAVGR